MKLSLTFCCLILVLAAASDAVEITEVRDPTFKGLVLDSDIPVLVEFWAPWCGSCVEMSTIVEEIAEQFNGKVAVYKVNADVNPVTFTLYGIRSIPTLMIFKGGHTVDTFIGGMPKPVIADALKNHLLKRRSVNYLRSPP